MTHKQFRRMQVFALRMTKVAIGGKRWQKALYAHVAGVLYEMARPGAGIHYAKVKSWDHEADDACQCVRRYGCCCYQLLCDFISTYEREEGLAGEKILRNGDARDWETKTAIALRCCLRAACDLASEASMGVAGFTAGEVRKMWAPKQPPPWVTEGWEREEWGKEERTPVDFFTLPDNAHVWL